MLQRQLQVVDHRQPRSGCSDTFLLPCPDQVLRASLAEVVQLGGGTPPALFQLGYPCSGFLQRIGLRRFLLWGLLLVVSLLLGHDQREVNSASITSSESSPPDSRGELSVGPADAPAVAPARAEAARDCSSWCNS